MKTSIRVKLQKYFRGYFIGLFLGCIVGIIIVFWNTTPLGVNTRNKLTAIGLAINFLGFGFTIFTFSLQTKWKKIKASQEISEKLNQKEWVTLKRFLISSTIGLEKYFKNRETPFPPDEIEMVISKSLRMRNVLIETLDCHESVAIGISQGVYDEETIYQYYGTVYLRNYYNFGSLIEYWRFQAKHSHMYENFFRLADRWNSRIKGKS